MSAAATDTIWFGATSISWTMSGVTILKSPLKRAETRVSLELALLVDVGRGLGDVLALLLERASTSSPRR